MALKYLSQVLCIKCSRLSFFFFFHSRKKELFDFFFLNKRYIYFLFSVSEKKEKDGQVRQVVGKAVSWWA